LIAQVLTRHLAAPTGDTTLRRIAVMNLALAAIRLSPDDFIFRKLTGTEPLFPSLKSHPPLVQHSVRASCISNPPRGNTRRREAFAHSRQSRGPEAPVSKAPPRIARA
jgi:hypothetical protein